jgi:polyhydroxyalkanoate synthesis regulator phasin
MAAPDSHSTNSLRDFVEEVFFAGVGAVALTKDRADELVDELTKRGRLTRSEAREVVDDVTGRWRGEAVRFGERASSGLTGVMRELGLVTRREWEELELRLAQVEHRLRLVESQRTAEGGGGPGARGRAP